MKDVRRTWESLGETYQIDLTMFFFGYFYFYFFI